MLNRSNYPKDFVDTVGDGLSGKLALLRYEYENRLSALREMLNQIPSDDCADLIQSWCTGLDEDCEKLLNGINYCITVMAEMESNVKKGLLSLLDEQVCADVSRAEQDILDHFSLLQRINSSSLQRVFDLNLPGLVKSRAKTTADLLRKAISQQMENTQLVSNELQELAIFVKERNKVITHPLDENHPE